MSKSAELILAEQEARIARDQLTATLVAIQSRVTPRALAREAIDEIRETGAELAQAAIDAAKRNPGPLIGIGATLIALLGRHWFADAFASTKATTPKPAAERSDAKSVEGPLDD